MSSIETLKGDTDLRHEVMDLVSGFTVETTPGAAAKIANYGEHLRPGTSVYITFLPGSDFADTVSLAKRLRSEGFEPIPHFAARSIPSRAFLEEGLTQLRAEADVREVLAIGGAVETPVGDFESSMHLLETGLFDRHGIERIGVAGHPEGSPDISDADIRLALEWKNAFNRRSDAQLYIVTQFCFEAAPIVAWERRLRAEGNRLPVVIGIPGLATVKTLMAHAKACGIGPSMKFLMKQASNLTKILTLSTPDRLLADLASHRASDPDSAISGVHMYPLGGLRRTAKWTYGLTDGAFELNKSGGFKVTLDID